MLLQNVVTLCDNYDLKKSQEVCVWLLGGLITACFHTK